ncbi:hypothetical protein [Sphaerisporangium corydalis]|uniref:Ricin B lectin domain-containing protein n=1 Tax=Sphaerisporangium corydalis TaxID=1441875 RepID=A0ABV9ES60_9ACTN|nr:hypothetical protein [Sphaerisporangium corydalis]
MLAITTSRDHCRRARWARGGQVLGPARTAHGGPVVLADDNGSNNDLWRFL